MEERLNMNQIQKSEVIEYLGSLIQEKIEEAESNLNQLMESRNNESKSSAGDKHETSRAMVQIELENAQVQLNRFRLWMEELRRINPGITCKQVQNGALLSSGNDLYFFGLGMGRLSWGNRTLFALSLVSPLGKAFQGGQINEVISFNGKEYPIEQLQ